MHDRGNHKDWTNKEKKKEIKKNDSQGLDLNQQFKNCWQKEKKRSQ